MPVVSFLGRKLPVLLLIVLEVVPAIRARAADFYPPLPAAQNAINFDNRGFLINGKRTFIASAGIEYARVPRALWRDRLLRIKRAGFNCVEIYTFWNFHEEREGKYDFTGNKDVGAFLDLAHQMGLYATVRVGPYVCAEWENGGYPIWLRFKPGMRVRQNDPVFLKYSDEWYDHILPIVAARQIERGGSVIMVQLENEHPECWGTADNNSDPYFAHLLDKARTHGIDVLTFFSGMNHGGDPAPPKPISSQGRPDPWYTTEYWSGWYSMYGAFASTGENSLTRYTRAAWRFLENGGNGFNVYMFHGGSNFATWNNNETSASYDYAAPVGQGGDLRPIYYAYKRVSLFGRSFQDILENGDNSTPLHQAEFPGLTVAARTGPAGTLVFLDNPGTAPAVATFPDGLSLGLAPGEVTGLVRDCPLDPSIKLTASESRILGVTRQGTTTTLVIYGAAGTNGRLTFSLLSDDTPTSASSTRSGGKDGSWSLDNAGSAILNVTFPAGAPETHTLPTRSGTLRVIAMTPEQADDTFFIDTKSGSYVVTGAPYVGDFAPGPKAPHLTVETPLEATSSPALCICGPQNSVQQMDRMSLPTVDSKAPALGAWKMVAVAFEAAPDFSDSAWLSSPDPLPMGVDGDTSAYAWYRTSLQASTAGTQYLQIPFVGDHAMVFLNGKRTGAAYGPGPVSVPLALHAGSNALAILVSHRGRNKFGDTFGPIDRLDQKGLVGPVRLSATDNPVMVPKDAAGHAYWTDHPPLPSLLDPNLDTSGPGWQKGGFDGGDGGNVPGVWREPFVFVRAVLPDLNGTNRRLQIGFVYDKVTASLNGQEIGELTSAQPPTDFPLDRLWKKGGPNILSLAVENKHAMCTVGMVTLTSGTPGTVVNGWRMRGNVTGYRDPSLPWGDVSPSTRGVPTYYRTSFTCPADYYASATPVLRLSTSGMSRGFVWLNGHNLGRYPEKIPIDGLYLPECWISPGPNDVVILDEEGAPVSGAHLYVETVASRRVVKR